MNLNVPDPCSSATVTSATTGCSCGGGNEICSSGQTCIPSGGPKNDGACAGTK